MDQASAPHEQQGEATPIFGAYRRGYDPEQVDRYVADQQRRLDETTQRASEAERKLAAAVGQLRELHRRVAVLESEDRSPQPAPLDTLGERVQRILQEAWEGAYALRQATEQEMAELRERTAGEAEAVVIAARQRARAIEEEIERRRNAYLEQVEEDRSRAVAQITHLHHERDNAVGELLKVKAVIEATVTDIARRRRPAGDVPAENVEFAPAASASGTAPEPHRGRARRDVPADAGTAASAPRGGSGSSARALVDDGLAETMPVHHLATAVAAAPVPSPSELVRNHRASTVELHAENDESRPSSLDDAHAGAAVFDFEEQAGR